MFQILIYKNPNSHIYSVRFLNRVVIQVIQPIQANNEICEK